MRVESVLAQATCAVPELKEWDVEFGGRTRDPYAAPDGRVWFVGQQGKCAYFDPDGRAPSARVFA